MSQIITINFLEGQHEAIAAEPLEQWAYGQNILFTGIELPEAYQVDFSNYEFCGTSIPRIGGADGVSVPVEVLASGRNVYAFIWSQDETSGRRPYRATIRVIPGPIPNPEEPNPEEESMIGETLAALNAAAEKANDAKQAAEAAADASLSSAEAAAASADGAATSAQDAADSAQDAQDAATASASSARDAGGFAQDAADSATVAAGSAQDAAAGAQAAQDAAAASANSARDAAESAQDAAGSATAASGSAGDAQAASQAAAGFAQDAAGSATAAAGFAQDAAAAVADVIARMDSKAGILRDTASGEIVSIVPDATVPKLLGLTAAINPVQDLHGYDYPWPGGGGRNLFDASNYPLTANRFINYNDGSVNVSTANAYAATEVYVPIDYAAGKTITLNLIPPGAAPGMAFYDSTKTYISGAKGTAVLVPSNAAFMRFTVPYANADGSGIQIEYGSTPTEWTPYSNLCPITGWTGATIHVSPTTSGGTTYSITFPTAAGTVYGGTLDVVNGVLTVGWEIVDLASLTWSATSWGGWRSNIIPGLKEIPAADNANLVAEKYKSVSRSDLQTSPNSISTGLASSPKQLFVNATESPTGSCVYPLATPVTYTLTPQDIATILGQNNVWADTGDVTVEYAADLKTYIDSKIAAAVAALS